MKKIFISLLISIVSVTLGMAQVTLKKYDDPKKSQFVEKIIFGEANSRGTSLQGKSSEQKVFDIQENNPYNTYGKGTKKESRDGSNVYKFKASNDDLAKLDLSSVFPNGGADSLTINSNTVVATSGDFTVVGYQRSIGVEGLLIEQGRRSSFIVLDRMGNEVWQLSDIASDFYSLEITPNGRYFGFASGQWMAESNKDLQYRFHVYEVGKNEVYYEENVYTHGMIRYGQGIRIVVVKNNLYHSVFVDQSNGNIYAFDGDSEDLNVFDDYVEENGKITRIEDLRQLK